MGGGRESEGAGRTRGWWAMIALETLNAAATITVWVILCMQHPFSEQPASETSPSKIEKLDEIGSESMLIATKS